MDIKTYETPLIEVWDMLYDGLLCMSTDDSKNESVGENQGTWIG